jgi:AmmeMemoRadiSam system protein A
MGEDVAQNSVEALLHDPRFPPATAREFPRYQVEISVLTAREPIEGPADIEIGRHGLYVEKASRRGLLLPQVAPEWGWTPEKFLGQVCLKAGLPADAWQNGNPRATVSRFGADVFSEDLLLVTPAP